MGEWGLFLSSKFVCRKRESKQASEGQISGDAKDIRHFTDVCVCACVSMFLFGNLWSMVRLASMKISMTPNGVCTVVVVALRTKCACTAYRYQFVDCVAQKSLLSSPMPLWKG